MIGKEIAADKAANGAGRGMMNVGDALTGAVSAVVKSSDRLPSDPHSFTSRLCYGQIIFLLCHSLRRCKMEINNNNPLHRIDVYMKASR